MKTMQTCMTPDAIEALEALALPRWAVAVHPSAPAQVQVGAALATRDGRRFGNALVFYIDGAEESTLFHIITDMGNTLTLTQDELADGFYSPSWVCCAACGIASRAKSTQQKDFLLDNYDVKHHDTCTSTINADTPPTNHLNH
jgi:hypothetical protein